MIKDRYTIERQLWDANLFRVMGLDEVGRGCLCGPVVAAGVILNPEDCIEGLADSKTISRKQREMLAEEIEMRAVYTVVKECSPAEIDELNILKASISAMVKCAEAYGGDPDYLLIDGNRFTSSIIPYQCIVKGDDRSASIAAASILAKVHRDKIMHEL
ncbi:MAG: ribonuclease HII, partial [Balneolaceae bacterium]